MTIDEAIILIEHCAKTHARYDRVEVKAALKLGIEALKRTKRLRGKYLCSPHKLLPGEDPPDPKTIPIETSFKIMESPLGREPQG